MLDEARRRCERGTDVVVGYVETHGRANTAAPCSTGSRSCPARRSPTAARPSPRWTPTPSSPASPPWCWSTSSRTPTCRAAGTRSGPQDVEDLRAAGIDVITTVNIQHLESINDEVERITGVRQRETVPDDVVRTADQIQLVDMAPDALRRRMAHGNIYRPEQIDASLASYFRVGNLTALRELALLWLADRVDDALDDYRRAHDIEAPWPTKERIVVAVTGGAESETLLRRGARLAQRAAGSELLAVHVIATDGLRNADDSRIARSQQLVESLGGTFHSVVGEDVPEAVVDFATRRERHHDRRRRLPAQPAAPAVHRLHGRPDRLAGRLDRRPPGHPRAGGRCASAPACPSRRSAAAGRPLGWLLALLLPVAVTAGCSRSTRPASCPWPSCSSSPAPSWSLWSAGRCRRCSRPWSASWR